MQGHGLADELSMWATDDDRRHSRVQQAGGCRCWRGGHCSRYKLIVVSASKCSWIYFTCHKKMDCAFV
ncbi:hypothetical protein BsWGS_04361 [Bradybaena similaris]